MYGISFVVTGYDGETNGHFGDSIQYVTKDGKRLELPGKSSYWGCSHSVGNAIEAADEPPFCTVCAEDQGGYVNSSCTKVCIIDSPVLGSTLLGAAWTFNQPRSSMRTLLRDLEASLVRCSSLPSRIY